VKRRDCGRIEKAEAIHKACAEDYDI
jgi:hypothetical protein